MASRLVFFEDLRALGVPYSREHVWRLERAGQFPRRVRIGARVAWVQHEVEEWIEKRIAARERAA